MTTAGLILCSGAEHPAAPKGTREVALDSLEPHGNVRIKIQNVTDHFGKVLTPRLADFLEIASYVFAADCALPRDESVGDREDGQVWSRNFHFVIPVRDTAFWTRDEVGESLVEALGFLSSDTYEFEFPKLTKTRSVDGYLDIGHEDILRLREVERVLMFSGGLDSLAGAVETAANGGNLALVSHRSVGKTDIIQRNLYGGLKSLFPAVEAAHIPVWINKHKGESREHTQRTRTFLFATLGTIVAQYLEAGGVRFYENGVTSLQLPVAEEVLQSRASRTTHPKALQLMERLCRLVTERELVIDCPYHLKTKKEVVEIIAQHRASELISKTCSCSRTMFRSGTQWHCGECSQCIDRRAATLAAGLEDYDLQTDYVSDVFTGPRTDDAEKRNMRMSINYWRHVLELNRMSEQQVLEHFSREVNCAARCLPIAKGAVDKLIQMLKRHAESALHILLNEFARHAQDFLEERLDPLCILAVIGRMELFKQASADLIGTDVDRPRDGNVFRKQGDKWVVRFGKSEENYFDDLEGMTYLHYLIEHPNKPIPADDLYYLVHPRPSPENHTGRIDRDDLPEDGSSIVSLSETGNDGDGTSLARYQKAVRGLEDEEAQAERRGDPVELAEVRKRKEKLLGHISSEYSKGGLKRAVADPLKKQRQAVSRAIKTALEHINKSLPSLSQYLDDHIKRGTACCYWDDSHTPWATS